MFVIICLFGRQFLKSGILVDFSALNSCFDEYFTEQERQLVRTSNLKRMSMLVTEKVKTIVNQETVVDEDILKSHDSLADVDSTTE